MFDENPDVTESPYWVNQFATHTAGNLEPVYTTPEDVPEILDVSLVDGKLEVLYRAGNPFIPDNRIAWKEVYGVHEGKIILFSRQDAVVHDVQPINGDEVVSGEYYEFAQ